MIIPVILAGGSGIRLWPLSRQNMPKQMLQLADHDTLLRMTLQRIKQIPDIAQPLIVGNYQQRFILREQMRSIDPQATIFLEAEPRNTALAVAVAALYAMTRSSDPLLLILPTDHLIADAAKFAEMIAHAVIVAKQGELVTFGVKPTTAEIGYGYIQTGKRVPNTDGYFVEHFVEKPSHDVAQQYVDSNNYYWNSGIFLFKASAIVRELKKYADDVLQSAENALKRGTQSKDFFYLDKESMRTCPTCSIDQAVFESTDQAVVFPFPCEWHDIGDWEALYRMGIKDQQGNVCHHAVVPCNTENSYLYSDKQLLVTSGIKDCLVVVTPDVILVARRDEKQDIKKIVNDLVQAKHPEAMMQPICYRPWGYYEVTERTTETEVRHYVIHSQKALVAHAQWEQTICWIVVSGRGQLTSAQTTELIASHESIRISPGVDYRLKNTGTEPLKLMKITLKVN